VRGDGEVAAALRAELARRGIEAVASGADAFDALFVGAPPPPARAPVAELEVAAFDEALERGLLEPFRLLSRALPRLAAAGGCAVVEVSAAAIRAAPGAGARAAVDTALVGLARAAALEYGADGARVNVLLADGVPPDEAARVALELLSAAGVNGAVVAVDGGATATAYRRVEVPDAPL
jgi:NAD(P)-dependent dehydrogenase (short-subunit alcohol dehydrogenase family)